MRVQQRLWEFRLDISASLYSVCRPPFGVCTVSNERIRLKFVPIVVLLLLAMVGVSMGRNMKIALLAPLSGSEAPAPSVIDQWTELSRAVAANITAAWQSSDTLMVEVLDTRSSKFIGLSAAASVAADLDIYAVILLGLTTDQTLELVRFFRLQDVPCIVSSKLNDLDSDQQLSGPSNFFSIHALTENIPVALSAFAAQFHWTKIALIVDTTFSAPLRNATWKGVSVTPINAYHTNLDDVYSQIHLGGFTIIAIASSDVNLTNTLISKGDTVYGLYVAGNAWIVFGSPTTFVLKAGITYVEYVELPDTNVTLFEGMLSMLPSYDGRIENCSAHLYDSIHVAARAMKSVGSSLARKSVRDAIAATDWIGMTGKISFAEDGFRLYHPLNVWNAAPASNASQTIGFSRKYTIAETILVPAPGATSLTFPGPTQLVPKTDVNVLTVIWLIQPGAYSLSVKSMSEIVHYAAEVANGQRVATYPTPRLPSGTQLRVHALSIGDREVTLIPVASRLYRYSVLGVISDASSSISVLESALLDPYEIIQLSEAATNPSLSDKTKHPFFIRTVPPDSYQARAILTFCKNNDWSEITTIHSALSYGVGLDAQLALEAVRAGVTLTSRITLTGEGGTYVQDLERLADQAPHIVLIIADNTATAQVYKDMKALGIAPRAIIVSDGGNNVLQQPTFYDLSQEDVLGWVGTLPSGGYGPSFELFKREVKSESTADLPGLQTYFAYAPNIVAGLIDTVYVYADAIQRLIESGQSPRNTTNLFQGMKETNRLMLTGDMKFDSNADRIGDYEISNVVPNAGYQTIGRISPEGEMTLSQPVIWPDGTTKIPIDVDPRPAKWFYWNHPAAIVFSIISALGMLLSIVCFVVLVHQKDSSVVRVATWQFLLVMVFGCILGYASVFTWIGRPRPYICALRIWFPPMAFILIMAPLITKTWRLHRIFTLNNFKLNPFPFYYLVLMCGALGLVQVIICVFWIAMGTTRPTIQTDIHDKEHNFLGCGSNIVNRIAAYVTYSYLGILMIIGSYIAFRVRTLPKDFNESRWIGFSIYNTLLFSVIILIIGYALSQLPVTVLILACVCTIAIATGAMCFMVAPKIWILIFYPERRANYSAKYGDRTSQSKFSDAVLQTIPVQNSSKTDG